MNVVERDRGRPLRMLFANDEPSLTSIALLLEWVTKRQITLVEFKDLADLHANARQTPCGIIFVSCSGCSVTDSARPAGTHWRDLLPGVARLHREFPSTPIICTAYHFGVAFPARVAEAGARLLKLPHWLEDLEKCLPASMVGIPTHW